MLGVGLASAAGALAITLTARAAVRLRRHALADVASVEKKLRAGNDAEFTTGARQAFPDAAPALVDAMNEKSVTASNAAAVALDESLGDLDRVLSEGKAIPGAAIRVALLSAGLGAIVELVGDLGRVVAALPAAVIGVTAAAICFELGRNTARRAAELRAEWDRVAAAAAARLPHQTHQRGRRRRGS